MPKGTFPDSCCQLPRSCGEPLPTASTGDPPTLAGSFGSVSCGVTAPFLWVLVHARLCLCPPRLKSLFPSVLQKSCDQIPVAFKTRFPRPKDSQSFVGSQDWEAWRGVQNLHNSGRTSLVLLFSSLWVTHLVGMGFDFIVIMPLLPSQCSFFFVFGWGVSFFGGLQCPPVDDGSTASFHFGALAGGDGCTSFYCTILKWKTQHILFTQLFFMKVEPGGWLSFLALVLDKSASMNEVCYLALWDGVIWRRIRQISLSLNNLYYKKALLYLMTWTCVFIPCEGFLQQGKNCMQWTEEGWGQVVR